MTQKLNYIVGTKEELERLRDATDRFLENYSLRADGEICIRPGKLEKTIIIFPNKGGRIEEINPARANPRGTLVSSSSLSVAINIGDTRYLVNYGPYEN